MCGWILLTGWILYVSTRQTDSSGVNNCLRIWRKIRPHTRSSPSLSFNRTRLLNGTNKKFVLNCRRAQYSFGWILLLASCFFVLGTDPLLASGVEPTSYELPPCESPAKLSCSIGSMSMSIWICARHCECVVEG